MWQDLRETLRRRGWKLGRYKGFLQTRRAGIQYDLGPAAGADRLELRYAYHTERTQAEGDVPLSLSASLGDVEDAIAGIYLRVHEKPDYGRVAASRRARGATAAPAAAPAETEDTGQLGLELEG